jgi:Arc/MetJ-type ribon-helix-helix transcriptional regulator
MKSIIFSKWGLTLKMITVKLPDKYIEAMDSLVIKGRYYSRSEIIREALNEFLRREFFQKT